MAHGSFTCSDAVFCCLKTYMFISGICIFILQESGMTLITAEDLDDAAEKAVKASVK